MTDHDDGKWDCPPHTKAKHEMLAKYLDAWYPIIASWKGRLVFLDGSPGAAATPTVRRARRSSRFDD